MTFSWSHRLSFRIHRSTTPDTEKKGLQPLLLIIAQDHSEPSCCSYLFRTIQNHHVLRWCRMVLSGSESPIQNHNFLRWFRMVLSGSESPIRNHHVLLWFRLVPNGSESCCSYLLRTTQNHYVLQWFRMVPSGSESCCSYLFRTVWHHCVLR